MTTDTTHITKEGLLLSRIDEFWKRVDKTDGCWTWTGNGTGDGYGRMFLAKGNVIRSNRASWIIHFGEIPEGMCVCHHCDNKICVRPDHLFLGTDLDNKRDMFIKKKHAHTTRHGSAKLGAVEVVSIKRLYSKGWKSPAIAERFSVDKSTILRVLRGESWRNLA
jgi:hypothetical protein